MIGRIGLMFRLEIKHFAESSEKTATGTENFPTRKPSQKDGFVRIWNIKPFAIHLFLFDFKIISDTFGNWVIR
jgi:hypothetical protein